MTGPPIAVYKVIKPRYARSVNVPFTGLLPEILDHTKGMTTRVDERLHYWNTFASFDPERAGRKRPLMHMFWQNPRRRHHEFYKIGVVEWSCCSRRLGRWLTEQDAILDGFGKFPDPLQAYKETLAETNEMTPLEVDLHVWSQLTWDRGGWIEGPHHPPEGSPAWRHFPEARRPA